MTDFDKKIIEDIHNLNISGDDILDIIADSEGFKHICRSLDPRISDKDIDEFLEVCEKHFVTSESTPSDDAYDRAMSIL